MAQENKIISPALRAFIEKQIEILERLADQVIEFQDEYLELKKAYEENILEALSEYASAYGFFESLQIKNKNEKNFFLVEPIRRQGKISLDNY